MNFASMLRQASQLNEKMQAVSQQLKQQRVTAAAGGGMVEVEVNGLGEVIRLKIDKLLIERGEQEMIEDLVPVAVNQAVVKARQLHMEAMRGLTEGLDLPGLDQMMGAAGGPSPEERGGGDKDAPWRS